MIVHARVYAKATSSFHTHLGLCVNEHGEPEVTGIFA